MKISLAFILIFALKPFLFIDFEVAKLRKLYYQAAEDKAAVKKLSTLLSNVNDKSPAILLSYKGATEMMEAKYAINPITKLSKFNKGKQNIEKAVLIDPQQVEVRFLRFSIQTNLPSFLGYNEHIKTDKQILINSIVKIDDEQLKENVINYLLISKQCTNEEIKKLKNWQKT